MSLTPKQEKFCEEYMIDLNATQATIRAGYEEKSAHVTGSRMLSNAKVQNKISELKKEHSERTGITITRVLEGLASIAFNSRLIFFDNKQISVEEMCDITNDAQVFSIQEIKTGDRLKALEKLYNHVTGTNDNPNTIVNFTMNDFYAKVEEEAETKNVNPSKKTSKP